MSCGLEDRVRFPPEAGDLVLIHSVKPTLVVHQAYTMGAGGYFSWSKASGA
jgi:hypothetical protein